jgi:hypothetical protein
MCSIENDSDNENLSIDRDQSIEQNVIRINRRDSLRQTDEHEIATHDNTANLVISDNSLLNQNRIQSSRHIKMEASEHEEPQTPLFKPTKFVMTEQERLTLEAVLKRNGVSFEQSPDNTQDQLILEPLLRIAQDSISSLNNSGLNRSKATENMSLSTLWVNTSGHIIR